MATIELTSEQQTSCGFFAVQREKSLSLAELTRQTAFAAAQGGLQLHT